MACAVFLSHAFFSRHKFFFRHDFFKTISHDFTLFSRHSRVAPRFRRIFLINFSTIVTGFEPSTSPSSQQARQQLAYAGTLLNKPLTKTKSPKCAKKNLTCAFFSSNPHFHTSALFFEQSPFSHHVIFL